MEAIHSFDPEASSPSLDKNLLSLYIGERVVILGKYDFFLTEILAKDHKYF